MTAVPVLVDLVPGDSSRALRTAGLTVGGAAFLAVLSQVAVPLPFTPVPISLATAAVVLLGAGMGPRLAAMSTLTYLIAGLAGAPVFAGQGSGWAFASFGYVIGYIPAAVIAGVLARRAADRSVWRTAALAGVATIAVYAIGVPWLMAFTGSDLATGLAMGVWPFLIGDAVKLVAAALILPGTWKVVDHLRGEH